MDFLVYEATLHIFAISEVAAQLPLLLKLPQLQWLFMIHCH
jgi:hypothetical protein